MIDVRYITVASVGNQEVAEKQARDIGNLLATGWKIISAVGTEHVVHYILTKEKE